jgi:CHAT domain-containing protein
MIPEGEPQWAAADYLSAVRSRRPKSKSAAAIFSVLLDKVVGQQPETRLIVVPDGKLNLLPFDALRDSQGRYVLESHVVTYAPSATVVYLLREHRSSERTTRNFLGVGGVVYSKPGDDGRTGRATPKANSVADFFGLDAVTFHDLPGSTQEVVGPAGVMRGSNQVLLEREATEAAFKALPISEFRIIHLAVHGVANTEFPDRAALVLGSSPASGEDASEKPTRFRFLPVTSAPPRC